jgi:hypothetical protein
LALKSVHDVLALNKYYIGMPGQEEGRAGAIIIGGALFTQDMRNPATFLKQALRGERLYSRKLQVFCQSLFMA